MKSFPDLVARIAPESRAKLEADPAVYRELICLSEALEDREYDRLAELVLGNDCSSGTIQGALLEIRRHAVSLGLYFADAWIRNAMTVQGRGSQKPWQRRTGSV